MSWDREEAVGDPLRSGAKRVSWALALSLVALLLIGPAEAPAEISFCAFGMGAGQCDQPAGVAVDRTSGHVFVVDNRNDRVNVFEEDGTFLTSFGATGSGSGCLLYTSDAADD